MGGPVQRTTDDNETVVFDKEYYVIWWSFFVIGTFNNFGYVVVLSAAKKLADSFNQSKLIGVEAWALIAVGFAVKSFNAFYCEHISHRIRGWAVISCFLLGYLLLSISVYIDFWFAIFAIVVIGAGCSGGESVMLGYLKCFPSKMGSAAFSSGTGMAGVGGAGLYLLLDVVLGFSNQAVFLTMIPTVFLYGLALEITWRSPMRNAFRAAVYTKMNPRTVSVNQSERSGHQPIDPPLLSAPDNLSSQFSGPVSMSPQPEIEVTPTMNNSDNVSNKARIFASIKLTLVRCVCLYLVYFFEYVISVGLAQMSNTDKSTHIQDRRYAVLALCYQFGVFLSRSSLSVMNLSSKKSIIIMTVLQCLNFILWMFHVKFTVFISVWLQYSAMIFVGLLGGCMYVNTVYSILSDKSLAIHEYGDLQELAVNVMALWVNLGILSSSAFDIVMDYTFFRVKNNQSS